MTTSTMATGNSAGRTARRSAVAMILMAFLVPGLFLAGCSDDDCLNCADLPAPVRSTIDARRGDATLGDIDLSSSDDGDVYDVELVRDGRVEELEIAPDGTVLATEIETPDDLDEQGDTDDDDDDDDEDDDDEDDDDEDDEDEKD